MPSPRLALLAWLTLCSCAAPARAEPWRILAFGDSLTAGYGLRPEEAFPAELGRRLAADGYDVVVANAGVSGDTTQMGLARLEAALAGKPDLVVLELGANDMLNGIDPKVTRANLEKMLRRIKASGARVVLAGMRALTDRLSEPDKRRFEAVYPDLARKYAVPLYPFFLEGVAGHPELVLWGGLHPKAEGVRIIAQGIAPLAKRSLGAARAR